MNKNKVVKIYNGNGSKKVHVSRIPANDIRVARNALAEDIVIAEIAIADETVKTREDVGKRIARLRGEIKSLENIDNFLKEIES